MHKPFPPLLVATAQATVMLAALIGSTASLGQSRGLATTPDALGGPVWQARFERDASALPPVRGLSAWLATTAVPQRLHLLGDYQFSTLRLGETGGLRLTGGLLINLRQAGTGLPNASSNGSSATAQPYAGVGYASGSLDGRWAFSADLGLAGHNGPGALRLARPAGLGMDNLPSLLPMLRLGMTMAF